MSSPRTGEIRIGPAGWSYRDWAGIVYPSGGTKVDPLEYLSRSFDLIEINSSFYRTPSASQARSWCRRVAGNSRFRFTAKLHRNFTHQAGDPDPAGAREFLDFAKAFAEDDRLGAVLVQFPWSFRDDDESRVRIRKVVESFGTLPLAIEVRHSSFASDDFYGFLDGLGVAFTNIDQPIFGDSVRPSSILTGSFGYVRLHGRNYGKWFRHDEAWERYDYLYSKRELRPWVDRIGAMAARGNVFVVTNNHFRGQAVTNALELKSALGQTVTIPEPLELAYPDRFHET